MLDLYDFQAEIKHKGVLSHNKYYVRIDPAEGVAPDTSQLRSLSLRCVNAQFPGIELATHAINRYGYGPTEKDPYNATFTDTYTSFLLDVKVTAYYFFYGWIKSIINFDSSKSMLGSSSTITEDTGTGEIAGAGDTELVGNNPYEVEYKDTYIADVTISPTSDLHNKSLNCILYRAYPVRIQEIPLDASVQNSPVVLTITWSYRDHKVTIGQDRQGSVSIGK